jgi:valyl-tRNA synthetase
MGESSFSKSYEPKEVETKWYQFWEKNGYFQADPSSKKPPFSISIPPPNVTGVLHMGHALVDTLQDVLVRFKRMDGFEALWIPGTDHAGIATQAVVERELKKKSLNRRSMTREEFLKHAWAWKETSEQQILSQLRRIGCSCDWSRLAFTMDPPREKAVRTAFKALYENGLIYRGDYLIHWDPVTQTALSDDEVEYEEKEGTLYFIQYPLEEQAHVFITVATTRPETLFGDTAIAVAPNDPRYENWIGKKVYVPLTNRLIPILADRTVDAQFGTGAVKVTPAHDFEDRDRALNFNLPSINILNPNGTLNEQTGTFSGLNITEGRLQIVKALQEKGFLIQTQPHRHRVGISYRSKAVIEPYLSKQWFVRLSQFKDLLHQAVETSSVQLFPSHWKDTYFHWIDNLRDWCISRQLWWGHRIPVWYSKKSEAIFCSSDENPPFPEGTTSEDWIQDEDVLDTWFSSALWPMAVLGWPEKTAEMQTFYPNSTLITGHDILFFWVARMIVMGQYFTGKPPFLQVFLHGLIYGKSYWRVQEDGLIAYVMGREREDLDLKGKTPPGIHSKWEKMSKSKGNIIDPIEICDQFGSDALRMALCSSASSLRQIDLDRRRFEAFKNFSNKIWNGARFAWLHIQDLSPSSLSGGIDSSLFSLEDHWIFSVFNRTICDVRNSLEQYDFDRAASKAYDFFWKELCSHYLELIKPVLFGKRADPAIRENKQKILLTIFIAVIRLLHPMAPFITEELFQLFKQAFPNISSLPSANPYSKELVTALNSPACIVAPYPRCLDPKTIQPQCEADFDSLIDIVTAIRQIRTEMQIPLAEKISIWIIGKEEDFTFAAKHRYFIETLIPTEAIHFSEKEQTLLLASSKILSGLKIMISLPEEQREKERARLLREREKSLAEMNTLQTRLSLPEFSEKAPSHVVEKMQKRLIDIEQELQIIAQKLPLLEKK